MVRLAVIDINSCGDGASSGEREEVVGALSMNAPVGAFSLSSLIALEIALEGKNTCYQRTGLLQGRIETRF